MVCYLSIFGCNNFNENFLFARLKLFFFFVAKVICQMVFAFFIKKRQEDFSFLSTVPSFCSVFRRSSPFSGEIFICRVCLKGLFFGAVQHNFSITLNIRNAFCVKIRIHFFQRIRETFGWLTEDS